MRVVAMNNVQKTIANTCGDRNEVAVPRAPVAQHGQFGAQGGGEWARGEKNGFALHGETCLCEKNN